MRALLLVALLLTASPIARAANPVVRFTTTLGDFDVELCESVSAACDRAAPNTVANFLAYVDDDDYASSIVHRSVSAFVIQGGSFRLTPGDEHPVVTAVPVDPPVENEFSGFPNRRGTMSVPLQGDGPTACDTVEDSGTNGWFINLVNNAAGLDCGLFTVFGVVLGDGMQVVDAISLLPKLRFYFPQTQTAYEFLFPLYDPVQLITAFTDVPFPQSFVDRFLDEQQPPPTPAEVADAFVLVDVARAPEAGSLAGGLAATLAVAALARRRARRGARAGRR